MINRRNFLSSTGILTIASALGFKSIAKASDTPRLPKNEIQDYRILSPKEISQHFFYLPAPAFKTGETVYYAVARKLNLIVPVGNILNIKTDSLLKEMAISQVKRLGLTHVHEVACSYFPVRDMMNKPIHYMVYVRGITIK